MRLSRWLTAIAILVGLGWLQVAQHNAILLKAYAIGELTNRVHVQAAEVSWLKTQVTGLASPAHLARMAQERRMEFVAWSTLAEQAAASPAVRVASAPSEGAD